MATNGLVTIRSGGKVVMKVVAGCNGNFAAEVAKRLSAAWPVSAEKACEIARAAGFGCSGCLIVQTESDILLDGRREYLPPIYGETFQKAEFNPRWYNGTAEFGEIVDL
jgi:hypothetical protein